MMALSVMVMCSGQTLVQHFVMLQIADAVRLLEFRQAVLGVERVHLQRGGVNEKARTDELIVLVMVAQDVADVLAEKTFDALAELLHAVDVRLLHAPRAVRCIGRAGLNFLIFFLTRKFHETSVTRSRMLGNARIGSIVTGLSSRHLVQPRHAHELRHAVDFRRAGAAFAGLAIPAAGEVVGLLGLDLVDDIEHDHAFGDFGRVIHEFAAAVGVAAPDSKSDLSGLISSPR